jgi:glycosyltransferase involved in cell wall biosynthesis
MRVLTFLNSLGIGGTEKAACRWAIGLMNRGHEVYVCTLDDGPRRFELQRSGILTLVVRNLEDLVSCLQDIQPDVIHAHAPGFAHSGDILGEALRRGRRVPVVQTNIFGRLENPAEDEWVNFRLFISWTSCVQAALRARRSLDSRFFEHASVAVYPLDADDSPIEEQRVMMREELGIRDDEVIFSRFSRPEPNKWSELAVKGFERASRRVPNIRLLLREAPREVCARLQATPLASRLICLNATSESEQLRQTFAASDVVLHTSSIGESFGYGIAEPMNLGRPVITNPVPWADQAQIELVGPGEAGLLASTPQSLARAIERLAVDRALRANLGENAKARIREIADPERSTDRLESALIAAINGERNPRMTNDQAAAVKAAAYLERFQYGTNLIDQIILRSKSVSITARRFFGRGLRWAGVRSGTSSISRLRRRVTY